MARDHDLTGGVEVYGFDALHLRRFGTRRNHAFVVESHDGGHRADTLRNCLLHRLRPKAHQWQRVGKGHRACRHQCRVFAQTVPGHHRRLGATCGAPRAVDRYVGGEHHRLRIHGLV